MWKFGSAASWASLITNLGVLLGLVFVAFEIQQASEIATAQIRLDYAAGWRTIDGARQDPEFAALIVQSVESPETLTPVQFVQLDAYYLGVLDQMLSAYTAAQAGVRLTSFETAAESVAAIYFDSKFAQDWWKNASPNFAGTGDFLAIMHKAISGVAEKGI